MDKEVLAALEENLLRSGVGVVMDRRLPHDANVHLSLTMRSAGVVAEGAAALTLEREGILIDKITVARDVYRRDHAAGAVARKLAEGLLQSPLILAFARTPRPQVAEPAPQVAVAERAAPPQAPPAERPPSDTVPPPATQTPAQPTAVPVAAAPLGKSGAFGKGINIELVMLGPAQAISAGGAEAGIGAATALQFDLGTRWAFRIPLALDFTFRGSHVGFADLSITPGILHRWRHAADQRWIPYAGAGVKLGSFGAHREFLGQPLVMPAALLELDDHHFGSGSHDPNVERALRAAPELWGGIEYHTSSWFSLDLCATYAWIRIAGENIHLFREMFGIRFSF